MNNQRPNEHLTSSPPFRGFTPTSEVGSGSVNPQGASEDNEEKWRLLLEQQNRNFLALLQVMKTPSVNNTNNVRLPEFDPDKLEVNAKSWITTADICMADQPLQGASLMIVLSRAMRGQASAWLSQVSYAGITWNEFKELFVSRYDCPKTSAAFLINLSSSKPKEGECIASYAASLMNSLMNQWKNLTTEEITLSTTMAHIARFESRVQRLAFTTDIVTRNQLHNELKAMSFFKRRSSDSLNERNEGSEFKRYKFTPSSSAIKCFLCGKMGHRASTCRSRKENHEKERQIGIQKELWKKNSPVRSSDSIKSFKCQKMGHYALRCHEKAAKKGLKTGAEILSQGLSVLMTVDTLKLTKTHVVNMCNVTVHEFDHDSVDTDIPLEFKSKLVSILNKFKNHFVYGTPKGGADVEPVKIRLKDPNKTVYRRPYRLSEVERKIVRDKINELLNAKVIRPSSFPFASPILLVKKKDGSDRMCIDYRELNDNTVPERFPLPLISDQINRLHRCYYFTVLDMASGYHQLLIHPDSIENTAFINTEGHFEYLALPFGLRNAPAAFQRAVITALGELANTYVVVYMDDILVVGTQDVEESLNRVENILNTLTKAGFSLNIKKCSFMKQKVKYLGYEVSRGEFRPNPRKIEALVALPSAQTVSQLRQFIGLASYFRQFLPKFSQILAPLFALTSSAKKNLNWKPDHEAIRQKIITFLTNEPVLTIYNPENPTELHTDASSIGYGAILMQKKEDCSSLQASRKKLDLTPRVHRWWAFLQAFDFDIVHRDGKRMSHADFFPRNPLPEAHPKTFNKVEQKEVYTIDLSGNWNMLTAAETSKERSWQDALSDVQLALNYDIEPQIDVDEVRSLAVANMDKNAEYDKTRFDRTKAKVDKFVIGDFVLLQNEECNQTKLDPKYKGPFKVVDVLDGDRYILTALDSNRRYKYSHDRLKKMPDTSIEVGIQD
ncbi:uncharacterized protein LOC124307441 [Neodiprion virginianus]|uniref:uncharacterized protein LOC124307441 n=1 Tax=Neodiprion virginianus TaxID=2961670 RepID=UPI001EE6D6C3|nr:uncharacterized protein LOC124307441 [Neodiprion virginianus]